MTKEEYIDSFWPITNDYMFNRVMEEPEILSELLEILGPESHVHLCHSPIAQKTFKLGRKMRGVRFDIFAQTKRYIYDVEMQNSPCKDLMKRIAHYESVLRVAYTKEGKNTEGFPSICVIFICFDDATWKKAISEFDGVVDQDNCRFITGAHNYVYNANRWASAADERQKSVLRYFQTTQNPDSKLTKKIHSRVEEYNMDKEWKKKRVFHDFYHDADCREEGRREGRKEGRMEGRKEGRMEGRKEGRKEGLMEGHWDCYRKLASKGWSASRIASGFDVPEREVQECLAKRV